MAQGRGACPRLQRFSGGDGVRPCVSCGARLAEPLSSPPANFKRPVVILGPISDIAMEKLSAELPDEFEIARKCSWERPTGPVLAGVLSWDITWGMQGSRVRPV